MTHATAMAPGAAAWEELRMRIGSLVMERRCLPETLDGLTPDMGLGAFGHYAPGSAARQHAALCRVASLPDGHVTAAFTPGKLLVGFVTFHPPGPDDRWTEAGPEGIIELGGIEVARAWRGLGQARRLLRFAMADPAMDDLIVYATGYTWCWDLGGTDLTRTEYRDRIVALFKGCGFELYLTNEPNIWMDRANVLMVRVGGRVSPERFARFHALLVT